MHAIYTVYLLVCTLQLPFFLVLWAWGNTTRCILLSAHPEWRVATSAAAQFLNDDDEGSGSSDMLKNNGSSALSAEEAPLTSSPFLVVYGPQPYSLFLDLWGMSVSAVLLAVMYMVLTRSTITFGLAEGGSGFDDDGEPSWWPKPDATYQAEEPSYLWLCIYRACFWTFVWFQGHVLTAAAVYTVAHGDRTIEYLWLQNGLRFLGLLGTCHTFPPCRKYSAGQAAAGFALVLWLCSVGSDVIRLQSPLFGWWVIQPLLLDSVLLLAHLYEVETSLGVCMNSRLFFVATSSSLTLAILALEAR